MCWDSHYAILINFITIFSSSIEVLKVIFGDGLSYQQRCETNNLLHKEFMQSFDLIFCLHLIRNILGITNKLLKINGLPCGYYQFNFVFG